MGGVTYKANLRAFAEISLGATAFEACRYLQSVDLSQKQRVLLSVAEVLCYGLAFAYFCTNLSYVYDSYALALLFIGVIISFSERSALGDSALFHNRFFCYLGSLALPMFLVQYIPIKVVAYALPNASLPMKCILIVGSAFVVSVIAFEIVKRVGAAIGKMKDRSGLEKR